MQKKLIALAIAGLVSAPVFAQSNVTIYGVADAYMGYGSHGDNDFRGIGDGGMSGSRLGFRGTEDLGNGLKGVFTFEQGFNIDSGSDLIDGKSFARQAFVGLAGNFGAVTLGRQYAPGYDFQYDALVSTAFSPQSILSKTPIAGTNAANVPNSRGLTISPTSAARWDNSLAYNGSFSGIKVRAIYSFQGVENNVYSDYDAIADTGGDRTQKPGDDDAMGLGLEYANGPLKIGGVYHYLKDAANTNATDDQTEWLVGGSYDFGVLTLAGSYQAVNSASFVKDLDAKLWQVGVIVPVSAAGNIHAGYGQVKYDPSGAGDAKSKSYTLAYTHALSKRTTLYTGYNETKNDDGLSLGIVAPASVKVYEGADFMGVEAETGEKAKLFVVGVRHMF